MHATGCALILSVVLLPVWGGWLFLCGGSGSEDSQQIVGNFGDGRCWAGGGSWRARAEGGDPVVGAGVEDAGAAGRVRVVGHVGVDAALRDTDLALRLHERDG